MADCIIAGGTESMSLVPTVGYKTALSYDVAISHPEWYFGMGQTAENVAQLENVSREEQDEFAAQSQQRAVAAQELGGRVHDDVGAVRQRVDQVGAGDGVVDDERDAVGVGHAGDTLDVEHVVARVADGLAVERLGVRTNSGLPLRKIVRIVNERYGNAHLWERVVQQVVRTAVQRW